MSNSSEAVRNYKQIICKTVERNKRKIVDQQNDKVGYRADIQISKREI